MRLLTALGSVLIWRTRHTGGRLVHFRVLCDGQCAFGVTMIALMMMPECVCAICYCRGLGESRIGALGDHVCMLVVGIYILT